MTVTSSSLTDMEIQVPSVATSILHNSNSNSMMHIPIAISDHSKNTTTSNGEDGGTAGAAATTTSSAAAVAVSVELATEPPVVSEKNRTVVDATTGPVSIATTSIVGEEVRNVNTAGIHYRRPPTSSSPPPLRQLLHPKSSNISVTEEAIRNIQKEHLKQQQQQLLRVREKKTTPAASVDTIASPQHQPQDTPSNGNAISCSASTKIVPLHNSTELVAVKESSILSFPSQSCPEYLLFGQQQQAPPPYTTTPRLDLEYNAKMVQLYQQQSQYRSYHQHQQQLQQIQVQQQRAYYEQQSLYPPHNTVVNHISRTGNTLYYGDNYSQRAMTLSDPNVRSLMHPAPKPPRRRRRRSNKTPSKLPLVTKKNGPASTLRPGGDMTQILHALSKNDIAKAVQCIHIPPPPTPKKCPTAIRIVPPPLPSSTTTISAVGVSTLFPPSPPKGVRLTNVPILPKNVLSRPTTRVVVGLTTVPLSSVTSTESPNQEPVTLAVTTTRSIHQPTPTQNSSTTKNSSTGSTTSYSSRRTRSKSKSASPMRHIAVVSPPNCSGSYSDDNSNNKNESNNKSKDYNTCLYDGPDSGTTPPIHNIIPDHNVAATTTTTKTHNRTATSAFISYTSKSSNFLERMDVDHSLATSLFHRESHCSDAKHGDDKCIVMNGTNQTDVDVHDANAKYTDLLCLEEILSLSDSNHSHWSFITSASGCDYDDCDDETTTMFCDSKLGVACLWDDDDNNIH